MEIAILESCTIGIPPLPMCCLPQWRRAVDIAGKRRSGKSDILIGSNGTGKALAPLGTLVELLCYYHFRLAVR